MANIYVIDDDDQLLRLVGAMLERGGHIPTLHSDPESALNIIKEEPPDLLIVDVMMPHLSGHDLCRAIRADSNLAHIPILVMTARAQAVDREAALKSGADDYLSKPVNSQELIERIDNLLTHPKKAAGSRKVAFFTSFMSMRGGIGRTTLAVNLAGALRRVSQQETCLVELTPSSSQVGMHLRVQAKSSWRDLPPLNELEWDSLKQRLTLHPTGLRLLTSPPDLVSPEEPPQEIITRVLQILGEKMAAVIIDLPPVFNAAFKAAIEQSDMIFHVVTPEVISVQLALQTNRSLVDSSITMKQPVHILNQVSPEAQLPANAVERGLHARLAFQIAYDNNQPRALAQGVPLTLTSAQSPLPVTIKRMAEAMWQRTHQEQ